jgi:predicted ATPase
MMVGGVGAVSVTLLGGFAASVDGEPVADTVWRLKKARELIKLLALAPNHRLHREQVMDVLWRDRPPDAAANNLHQAIYVARRALGAEAIVVRDGVLELDAVVDVDRLEEAATEARRAGTAGAYRAALGRYAGELLPENRYDDWATERREELEDLADALAGELDRVGPEPERVRRLPAETGLFVGRERELAELRQLLRDTRLLTLAGPGGVGKTRLALALGREAEPHQPDGAALVELAPVADPSLVPDAVAAALDLSALPGQDLTEAIEDFLAPRSMLLVLDNCEHVLAACEHVADALLRSAPDLCLVATSREPLRVAGEVVFRVPSLDIPDPALVLAPEQLLEFEAVKLFVARAQAAAPGFALDAENARDVAQICFRLDGLPLALELAAGRIGGLGPAAIAERLDDRFRVLRTESRTAPTRQHTLAAALQWSHDLLGDDERMLLRRLAVFAGGFELASAERVCADDALPRAVIADVLARLVEKSLVAADAGTSRDRRYRLLETVRLYARERLVESGEAEALGERHAYWALTLAEALRGSPRLDRDAANGRAAMETLLARSPEDALRFCIVLFPFWLRRIDLHQAQLRFEQALDRAPERNALRAEALLAAAAIDYRAGDLQPSIRRAEESYELAAELRVARGQWRALQFLGECAIANDDAAAAMPWLQEALALARREGYEAGTAVGIYSLGVASWLLGDLAQAEGLVAESLSLLRALDDPDERIPSPVNIAEIRVDTSERRPGLGLVFEDTLQPFAELSRQSAVGFLLANQAGIVRLRGDLARAGALLDEAATCFEAAGDEQGGAAVLVRRAYLELTKGDLPAARAALEQALELRRRHSDRRGLGLALSGLGLVETAAGDLADAERHIAEARELFRRAGDRWGLASTLWRTADLAFVRGEVDEAEAALLEARAVLGATKRDRWIAQTLVGLADVALLRGEHERAERLLRDARGRSADRRDAAVVAAIDARLERLAEDVLRAGKEPTA